MQGLKGSMKTIFLNNGLTITFRSTKSHHVFCLKYSKRSVLTIGSCQFIFIKGTYYTWWISDNIYDLMFAFFSQEVPSEKMSILSFKNSFHGETNSHILERTLFQKGQTHCHPAPLKGYPFTSKIIPVVQSIVS